MVIASLRHAGSSAVGNLPVHRGFKSSLGYMGGAEDHYSQIGDYKEKSPDAYSAPAAFGDERDDQVDYASMSAGSGGIVDMWDTDGPAYGLAHTACFFVVATLRPCCALTLLY